MVTESYSTGQVAKALGLNVRRLEGWAEQGLLSPKVQRGQSRHGDRRQYAWPDILTAAVLAEAQQLLGAHFRPGCLAQIAAIGAHNYANLGTMQGARAALVLTVAKGKPQAEILYRPTLDHLPTAALVIDIARLAHRVEEALKHG